MLRISSGLGSARTGSPARVEARASTQGSALGLEPSSTHLDSRLYSELALVWLSSGLELDSVWAGKKCCSTDESLVNPYGQSSGNQNVVFDTFSMGSQRDTIFSTGFVQSHLNRCYMSWARNSARLGSELGPVRLRIVVRLDSGLFWLLDSRTQHEDSTRLDSTSLKARLSLLKSRTSSSRLEFTSARESGSTWGSLGARKTSSMLGSAELGARLGPLGAQFWAEMWIGLGLWDS